MPIAINIQSRCDLAATWTAANPILLLGEIGVETDTGRMKIGDGATAWSSLAYLIQISPLFLKSYASTSLPAVASYTGSIIWLSDTKCLAYSNGTNWLKLVGVTI
jgi:hypothetical protein